MYADYEIREVPIGYGPARRKVEEFLGKRTLRLDKVDYYEAIYPCGGDEMLAVGGLLGDAIRCIAVKEGMEDEHPASVTAAARPHRIRALRKRMRRVS